MIVFLQINRLTIVNIPIYGNPRGSNTPLDSPFAVFIPECHPEKPNSIKTQNSMICSAGRQLDKHYTLPAIVGHTVRVLSNKAPIPRKIWKLFTKREASDVYIAKNPLIGTLFRLNYPAIC